jgi:hypothetical protein
MSGSDAKMMDDFASIGNTLTIICGVQPMVTLNSSCNFDQTHLRKESKLIEASIHHSLQVKSL